MTAFHEERFPVSVSFSSIGGPERKTDIVTLRSGFEERNSPWLHARRRYDAGIGIRSLVDIEQVLAFFEARSGRLHGFRWKDYTDFSSASTGNEIAFSDQNIGIGDGVRNNFYLQKAYGTGVNSYFRPITKPIAETVRVGVLGIEKIRDTDFTVNSETGEIIFASGQIPGAGLQVTAGFQFDVPVRFDTDYLAISVAAFETGSIGSIPIVEIR